MGEILKSDGGVIVVREGDLVRKTVRGVNNSRLRRNILPKEIVDREILALQRLEEIIGIQKFVARESEDTFYTRYLEGASLRSQIFPIDGSYFNKLRILIRECESKGVYRIGQSREDFLVSLEGDPRIVDFGNILFDDDLVSKIPGVVPTLKTYCHLRISDLQRRYA